jgi:molecular chaperone DnaK
VREVARREGGPADGVAVTHPAAWGPHKVQCLRTALTGQGVGPLLMLTDPQAAAAGHAGKPGAVVAVYDVGGGTCDAAVVRHGEAGGIELLGRPESVERLAGVDLDDIVFEHVRQSLGAAWDELDPTDPAVLAAVALLRRECTAAKEVLSVDTEVQVPVMVPGTHTAVRMGRDEFEELVRPVVQQTVEVLRQALASAGVGPADLTTLLLVGGSSRIPLVAQLVSAGIGRPAVVDADPRGVVAAGAAVAARGADAAVSTATAAVAASVAEPPAADEQEAPAGWVSPDDAIARPAKVARPFSAVLPATSGKRTLVLSGVAGVLVLALTGGAIALAATGSGDPGPGVGPTSAAVPAPAANEVAVPQEPDPPAPAQRRRAPQQAPAEQEQAPAGARVADPPAAEAPVTDVPPETTTATEPPTTTPTTTTTTTTTTPTSSDAEDDTEGGAEEEGEGVAPAGPVGDPAAEGTGG